MVNVESGTVGPARDFIRDLVQSDIATGRVLQVVTRFPPEPNGFLHLGHAKAVCLNFGIAREFNGRCHLRFDDTNPLKEEQIYIDAIQNDVKWLGFDWGIHLYHASDYFETLYGWAEDLIRAGKAFIDSVPADVLKEQRGTLTAGGQNSPYRGRSIPENLDLFRRMRAGEFAGGTHVLRARIDMGSGNLNLRDPILYRILHAHHPRTGKAWCLYPTYDFAHGQSDSIEGVTHSICTLEFEDHRPLYDWLIDHLPVPARPQQIEFARLNITHTILSKRILTKLVTDGHVEGWDDPRMPTLAGLRRRGVPPKAVREFIRRVGIARAHSTSEIAAFDATIRDILNPIALRRMAVLRPLRVVIDNYPEGQSEVMQARNHPDVPGAGSRFLTFGKEIFIEQDDFMEVPERGFHRLSPGKEVRLRYGYFITCKNVVKNAEGEITRIHCTYDPNSRGGNAPDGRKVRATLHWVAALDSVPSTVRLYGPLHKNPDPDGDSPEASALNPMSVEELTGCRLEPSLTNALSSEALQFERLGYFCPDIHSRPGALIFSRTVGLKDSFRKMV